ncbi:hypothetical protein RSSM_00214 [Rhodopirellula sallentina SM41]|uniref:Uncharacterized protein n=1 Tax=Rhodopirellula sallentina SM41 TaxID=1263870 RepID=M5UAM0_9BACT|nr:hypothetical protein RSSM_00214 [Rhodopirellula sallentina SM41]
MSTLKRSDQKRWVRTAFGPMGDSNHQTDEPSPLAKLSRVKTKVR